MNKLVIIGNGFDLAHGLKTSYKDFILWRLKKAFEARKTTQFSINEDILGDLVVISTINGRRESNFLGGKSYDNVKSISDFLEYCNDRNLEIKYKSSFIEKIINDSINRWIDIETAYFNALIELYKQYEIRNNIPDKELLDLNLSFILVKSNLEDYLKTIELDIVHEEIKNTIIDIRNDNGYRNQEIIILNFNYTNIVKNYIDVFDSTNKINIINIHGELGNNENPIIFGYGDETNEYFEKIENTNHNEFTRNLKSFSYLMTENYRKLFALLEQADVRFRVYILGHSLGISDRLLLNSLFEHKKTDLIKIYFYEEESGNDYFYKTQELSRHFKLNQKHEMRKRVIPFSKSKPLIPYKQQN